MPALVLCTCLSRTDKFGNAWWPNAGPTIVVDAGGHGAVVVAGLNLDGRTVRCKCVLPGVCRGGVGATGARVCSGFRKPRHLPDGPGSSHSLKG